MKTEPISNRESRTTLTLSTSVRQNQIEFDKIFLKRNLNTQTVATKTEKKIALKCADEDQRAKRWKIKSN